MIVVCLEVHKQLQASLHHELHYVTYNWHAHVAPCMRAGAFNKTM